MVFNPGFRPSVDTLNWGTYNGYYMFVSSGQLQKKHLKNAYKLVVDISGKTLYYPPEGTILGSAGSCPDPSWAYFYTDHPLKTSYNVAPCCLRAAYPGYHHEYIVSSSSEPKNGASSPHTIPFLCWRGYDNFNDFYNIQTTLYTSTNGGVNWTLVESCTGSFTCINKSWNVVESD